MDFASSCIDKDAFKDCMKQLEKELTCPICKSVMRNPVSPQCNHLFCEACLRRAMGIKRCCPLCKSDVTRRQVVLDETVRDVVAQYLKLHGMAQKNYSLDILSQIPQTQTQTQSSPAPSPMVLEHTSSPGPKHNEFPVPQPQSSRPFADPNRTHFSASRKSSKENRQQSMNVPISSPGGKIPNSNSFAATHLDPSTISVSSAVQSVSSKRISERFSDRQSLNSGKKTPKDRSLPVNMMSSCSSSATSSSSGILSSARGIVSSSSGTLSSKSVSRSSNSRSTEPHLRLSTKFPRKARSRKSTPTIISDKQSSEKFQKPKSGDSRPPQLLSSSSSKHKSESSKKRRSRTPVVKKMNNSGLHQSISSGKRPSGNPGLLRSGNPELLTAGNTELHRSVNPQLQRSGGPGLHKSGSSELHRSGSPELQRSGGPELRRSGEVQQSVSSGVQRSGDSGVQSVSSSDVNESKVKVEMDEICSVCRNELDVADDDTVFFCDICNMGIHPICYGILPEEVANIKANPWSCHRCTKIGAKNVECSLCPNTDDQAFTDTDDGKWIHVSCSLYIPGPLYKDADHRTGVYNLNSIERSRMKMKCSVCRVKGGAVLQCGFKGCFTAYHVPCAARHGCCLEEREEKGEVFLHNFCAKHNNEADRATVPANNSDVRKRQRFVRPAKVHRKPLQRSASSSARLPQEFSTPHARTHARPHSDPTRKRARRTKETKEEEEEE
eukprot:119274_1